MPTRSTAPTGSPCWVDLWTSDVDGSRRFYSELFGWEAQAPSPEFHGYFMWTRNGVPVAGGMGDMPGVPASNRWRPYLATEDIKSTVDAAAAAGGTVALPTQVVADLGSQAGLIDPTGAEVGAWQAESFPGFTVLEEAGAPSWFELHTRDHDSAVAFYRSVFGWDVAGSEVPGLTYSLLRDPRGDGELAGIVDASDWLPHGVGAQWFVYWHVDDTDATLATVGKLGGSVVDPPQSTPYGRMATAADPAGGVFKLRAVGQ